MKDNPSSAEPRYSYSKPTAKSQPGLPRQLGTSISEYKLPEVDVETARRNFPGYKKSTPFSTEDLIGLQGGMESGTTKT